MQNPDNWNFMEKKFEKRAQNWENNVSLLPEVSLDVLIKIYRVNLNFPNHSTVCSNQN